MRTTRTDLLSAVGVALPASLLGFVPGAPSGRNAASEDHYPTADHLGGWRKLEGAMEIRKAAAMQSERLDQAFEYTKVTSRYGGLLVARRGYLVCEKYFARQTLMRKEPGGGYSYM